MPASTSSILSSDVSSSKTKGAETYTSCDAAEFSRQGACMTAWPSNESHHTVSSKAMSERRVNVKMSTSEKDPTYTAADAAEFSRRGASMVPWPGEEVK
jgi:hypothetical protein